MDVEEIFKRTTKERIIKYYIREYEKLRNYIFPACSQLAGRKIETGVAISDLKGGTSILLSPKCLSFVQIASSICQNYYPETLEM